MDGGGLSALNAVCSHHSHLFNRPPTQSDLFLSYPGIALTTAVEQKAVEPFDTNSNVASTSSEWSIAAKAFRLAHRRHSLLCSPRTAFLATSSPPLSESIAWLFHGPSAISVHGGWSVVPLQFSSATHGRRLPRSTSKQHASHESLRRPEVLAAPSLPPPLQQLLPAAIRGRHPLPPRLSRGRRGPTAQKPLESPLF